MDHLHVVRELARNHRLRWLVRFPVSVYKTITFLLCLIYVYGVLLKVRRFPIQRASRAPDGEKGTPMSINYRDLILIMAAGLTEAFLLWVLWNFMKAGRRRPARGGSWKITEGPKTRRAALPQQDLPAATSARQASKSEKLRSIRTPLNPTR
jgi:hypothetical protein